MMSQRIAAAALSVFLACGCAGVPKGTNMPGGYKMPPAPPAKVATPIDAMLRRDAEAELARNLASTDPVQRANAIEAIQRTSGAANAPRLLAALTDPSPIVRFAGAMAAGTLRLEPARARLLSMAEDANASVQVGVRFALHRLGDTRLSRDLETLAKHPDERVRSNVALALGLLGEPSAMNILKVMQRDLSVPVRLQVIEAMYRLGNEDARNKLVTGTLSRYPDDQIVSVLALAGPKDPKVLRYLRAQLTNDYDETKLAAARAVGMLGHDDGMAIALKAAGSKDVRHRSMAALALGDIGRTDAQATLKKLLGEKEPSVRLAAATAVLQLRAG